MTYPEVVDVLFSQLPMFQRLGAAAYKADLSATKRVCAALGHPERKLKFVHVAGTNGKGTVCHMVAASLQCAGHRVGLFTSPHLVDFRERIRVNGEMMPETDVVAFVCRWQAEDWGTPSFFELTFGMALDHFVQTGCEIVVLETGMGGRLDSTNVIPTAEACAITNIGLDHQQFLGADIRSIAKEKAGILKDGVPVVLGSMRPEAQSEILAAALRTSSEMHFALERVQNMPSRDLDEDSPVDAVNRATAFALLEVLESAGWTCPRSAMEEGLWNHPAHAGQQGRWQVLSHPERPKVILDGGHNVDGVKLVVDRLSLLCRELGGQLHVVWGAVADKDLDAVLSLLPSDAVCHWCQADILRALPADKLQETAAQLGLSGRCFDRVMDAYRHALHVAQPEDVVWVGGSLFVVGNLLRDLDQKSLRNAEA
jgi:dihydrofolate synthase/folylpolyglutamate synthase